jgi:hypothetical protein
MRVVLATGQRVADVALQPFADTALTMLHLLERERVEQLDAEARELRLVERVALAFHEPQRLNDERRGFLDRAGLLPSHDDAHDAGRELLAQALRAGITIGSSDSPPA